LYQYYTIRALLGILLHQRKETKMKHQTRKADPFRQKKFATQKLLLVKESDKR